MTFFDFTFDQIVQSISSSSGDLMNACSMFVVIAGTFVIGHGEIAFFGIENDVFLI